MFKGFRDSETFTSIPDSFFHKLLAEIREVGEMKVTLYALWRIEHMDGPFRALSQTDFDAASLGLTSEEMASGLEKAVQRGSLLKAVHAADVFYFLNSPRGRAAAEAFARGERRAPAHILSAPLERPNVFKLYEENIGPLTPLIADTLKDAEQTYSEAWVAEAIEIAVKRNARHWRFIEAILKSWKEQGRAEEQDRRDPQSSRQRDIERKIKKFIGR